MQMQSIAATLSAVASVVKESGKLPLYAQLLEMQQELLKVVAGQADLLADKSALAERIRDLEQLLRLREGFEHERNAYWKRDGDHVDGPFCSTCFDADGKAIRLIEIRVGQGKCGVCKNAVLLSGPVAPTPLAQRRVISPGFVDRWKR